jgi:hypothetical protein
MTTPSSATALLSAHPLNFTQKKVNEQIETFKSYWWILIILSLIHVFMEARRMKESPIGICIMVALCFWPIGYLLWIFYWPGTLRRKLLGQPRLDPILPIKSEPSKQLEV